jgi:mortality factor 4-like protein 1
LGERLRKATDDNRELAMNLRKDMEEQQRRKSQRKKTVDRSTRASEERPSSASAPSRGVKRTRVQDTEDVSKKMAYCSHSHILS